MWIAMSICMLRRRWTGRVEIAQGGVGGGRLGWMYVLSYEQPASMEHSRG